MVANLRVTVYIAGMDELTVAQAAESLGMADASVRRAILRGDIKARRVGARLLVIAPDEVERYKRERRPAGRPRETRQRASPPNGTESDA